MLHNLLTRLLSKRGIKNVDLLDEDEKKTFEVWQEVLQKEELDVEDIKNFCKMQIEIIENRWRDYTLELSKKSELLPYHTIWKMILSAIESPKVGKEAFDERVERSLYHRAVGYTQLWDESKRRWGT